MSAFFDKLLKNKYSKFIVPIILVIVVIVILFNTSGLFTTNVGIEDDYASILENKLCQTLSQVDGAGKVSVVITVESEMETVLAMKKTVTETVNGTEIEETPILVNGKTVVLKELYPKIIGVLIVAEGAKNIAVLSKIQQATVSLLDINVNQIEILTMK